MWIDQKSLDLAEAMLHKLNIGAFYFLIIAAIVSVIFIGIAWKWPQTALALVALKVVGPF